MPRITRCARAAQDTQINKPVDLAEAHYSFSTRLSRFCSMPSSLADGADESGAATMDVPESDRFRPFRLPRKLPLVPAAFPTFSRSSPSLASTACLVHAKGGRP
jgi:hypothetical protein